MSDPFFDKFIADLVKGAELNSRANGGPGVNVMVSRDNTGHEEKLAGHTSPGALDQRYAEGAKAATEVLGIKEAFLPMLGAIAGPTLARAGMSALGRGVAGKALGGVAGKIAPHITGGLGGAAFDQAASMAGGALGDKVSQSGNKVANVPRPLRTPHTLPDVWEDTAYRSDFPAFRSDAHTTGRELAQSLATEPRPLSPDQTAWHDMLRNSAQNSRATARTLAQEGSAALHPPLTTIHIPSPSTRH